jgi:hypothetical protein
VSLIVLRHRRCRLGIHLPCYKTVFDHLVNVFFLVTLLLLYVVLLNQSNGVCRIVSISVEVDVCRVSPLLVACLEQAPVIHHIVEHVLL